MWSPTGMSTSASSGRSTCRGPTLPAQVHGSTSLPRSSRATDSIPKVSRTRSSSASRLVSPRSTLPARKDRISDSARSRAAWWVRRAARSTTDATATATPMKTTMATMFVGSSTVRVCTGGVKNQLSSSEPSTAAARAGSRPPSRAAATVSDRNSSMSLARPRSVSKSASSSASSSGPAVAGQPAPDHPGPAEPRAPGDGQSASLAGLVVGDQVDVEVGSGVPGDGRADARPEHVLPALAPRDAQHDLGGVDPAREGQQRGRDVVADDVVEGAAEVLDEGALDGEFLGRGGGQPVAAGDVDGHDLAAGALLGEPGGPPDQGPPLGAAGQADDDPLARAPDPRHLVLAAVRVEVLVDPVRHPQQRQLPQGGQVAGPEVVRQGRVDLVGLVDVAVRHPPPQRLGRHVDQLYLVGPPDHLVGDRLTLPYPGYRLDDIAERLQVLDVDGRYDVDRRPRAVPRRPASACRCGSRAHWCGPARPRGRRRGRRARTASTSISVKTVSRYSSSRRGICSSPCSIDLGARPAVVLHEGHHAVGAAFDPAVRFGQHRVRLADARCRTEVDPKLPASHGPIVFP